jgi:ABC-type transporter Mla subunit MlaD
MFLLTAFLGFAGLVVLVAYKQGMFESQTEIHFHAPDATGINKGMAVRLHGVLVGTVNDVQLVERGVRVQLGIKNDYIQRLPRGSQARLAREGYVGAASIHILPSSSGADRTPVAHGDEIRFVAQKGVADILDEVRQQVTPALQELRRVAAEIANPDSDFRKSMTALRDLVEELPAATRELRQLARDTDRAVNMAARVGAQAERELPLLSQKLGATLDSLNATSSQARVVLGQAPELMRGSGELVRDTQELTQAARRTWLLRGYIEPSQMRTLPVDSFESYGKR